MKYKILLLNPISNDETTVIRTGRCQTQVQPGIECWPPTDLALIGTALKRIRDVSDIKIYDTQINKNYKNMLEQLDKEMPDIIVMNCTTPTCFEDVQLAKRIKCNNKDALIIFFGLHATAMPLEIMESLAVDCCVIGEPEDIIYSVVKHYINEGKKCFKNINNLFYLSEDKGIIETTRNECKSQVFLSQSPDRSLINNNEYKLLYNNKPFTIIQTSRGCTNNCIYCTSSLYSSQYVSRTVDSVISEVKECKYKYDINNFMFLSDTFTVNRKWIEKFCKEIINQKLDVKWMCNSRVDNIDSSLAKLMKKAGCWLISLGIESYDENILINAKKNITCNQISQAVTDLHSANIKTIGYFIFGLPGESNESIQRTIHFARKSYLDYAYFFHATPFPGTTLYEMAKRDHCLVSSNWKDYVHGKNVLLMSNSLSNKELTDAVNIAYRKFYYCPKRIIKQLSTIRSAKILLNNIRIAVDLLCR